MSAYAGQANLISHYQLSPHHSAYVPPSPVARYFCCIDFNVAAFLNKHGGTSLDPPPATAPDDPGLARNTDRMNVHMSCVVLTRPPPPQSALCLASPMSESWCS